MSPKRILIVAAIAFSRHLLVDYFTSSGYEVLGLPEGGPGGSTFFQTLAQFQPDLILLDLGLADESCCLLLEHTKLNPEFQYIPVIVISGYAHQGTQERVIKLGASRYFYPPTDPNYLLRAAQEVLEEARGGV